jgi:hypothetical protein
MGTLHNQPARQEHLKYYVSSIAAVAKQIGYNPDKMTPAQWHVACDVARTALAIQNADALDEQLSGFGEILHSMSESISRAADELADGFPQNISAKLTNRATT